MRKRKRNKKKCSNIRGPGSSALKILSQANASWNSQQRGKTRRLARNIDIYLRPQIIHYSYVCSKKNNNLFSPAR